VQSNPCGCSFVHTAARLTQFSSVKPSTRSCSSAYDYSSYDYILLGDFANGVAFLEGKITNDVQESDVVRSLGRAADDFVVLFISHIFMYVLEDVSITLRF
jgi:hypothetical protein